MNIDLQEENDQLREVIKNLDRKIKNLESIVYLLKRDHNKVYKYIVDFMLFMNRK